jgi:hypothetical protein
MSAITPLPDPPTRQDPTNFNDRADEFLSALESPFVPELNAFRLEMLSIGDMAEDAVTAAATATAAADAAQFTADALMWNAATAYVLGQNAISPTNFKTYRRKVAGISATDPSADATNWVLVNPDVKTATTGEAQAGTANDSFITPLRMREGFNASGSAPVFACRAWVNFNGTGTVAIRASGNVSSITDNGTGDYTVNFTTAMPDASYGFNVTPSATTGSDFVPQIGGVVQNTGSLRFQFRNQNGTLQDWDFVNVSIFR